MKWLLVLLFVHTASGADLTVYTYDSFTGKGSLGEWMASRSLAATGCKTRYVVFSTAGEALNQLAVDGKTRADVIVGIDETLVQRAGEVGQFEKLGPLAAGDLALDGTERFVPFDYGYLAVVYDDRRKNTPSAGTSFAQFAERAEYRKRLVLEDPRTSTLGRSLLVWSQIAFPGERNAPFWKKLLRQTLTLSPGWSAAYGLFLSGEADFVVSYTTSPAYHLEKEKNTHIRALVFPEGNYRQVESVAVPEKAPLKACAKRWVQLLLSSDAQKELPLRQWMYPVRAGVPLPQSFRQLPTVKPVFDTALAAALDRKAIQAWTTLAAGVK